MRIKLLIAGALLFFCMLENLSAQNVAIKTNTLYWATTTPNLALEFATGRRTTLDIQGLYNPFNLANDKKLKHWIVQPELRLWNCEKFNRGFWGLHVQGGVFNVANLNLPLDIFPKIDGSRLEGYMVGGGLSYGYQWYLGPHWNLEATIGVGYIYVNYDQFECGTCGDRIAHDKAHYFGPTKIGLTFVYLFKSKK